MSQTTGSERFYAEIYRIILRLDQRRLEEASELAARLMRETERQGHQHLHRDACLHWIEAELYKGEVAAAEAKALAMGAVAAEPYAGLWYLAILARIHLAQGRAEQAVEAAEQAYSRSQACGMGYCVRHATLLLVRAEAFHAAGDRGAAREAIREAEEDLLRRAARIPDLEVRRCFLENIPDHRQTLELARQWLRQDGAAVAGEIAAKSEHSTTPR